MQSGKMVSRIPALGYSVYFVLPRVGGGAYSMSLIQKSKVFCIPCSSPDICSASLRIPDKRSQVARIELFGGQNGEPPQS
jgi:hypothetical protein